MKIPKFNEKDLKEIHTWLQEWNKWRNSPEGIPDLPDFTRDTIHLLPLIIALLKSEAKLRKLTLILIILTSILAIQTFLLTIR